MVRAASGPVHLIMGSMGQHSGISRYCRELYRSLQGRVQVQLCSFRVLPLAGRVTPLEHLPLGITPDEHTGIYHFTRIMGCSLMLWRPVRPAVATVHDLGPLVWPGERSANWLDRALFRLSLLGLRRMDRIVAVSHATGRSIVDRLGIDSERVRVIYEGVDHDRFRRRPDARARLEERFGVPQRASVHNLLFVGSEAPRKNLATLLDAVVLLKEADWQVRLIKVGSAGHPGYRAAFQRLMETLGLEDSVVLVGEVAEADLPLFYSAADVFVLPSYVEGFGLPALEAMACGTPVVCSNAGALPEVVGDAGLLVQPGDAQGFAAGAAALLRDARLRERLAEAGLRRCHPFSWDRMAEQTTATYAELRHPEMGKEDGEEGSPQFES